MSLKSLRASLMDDVLGENTRKDYLKDNLFTYNHRADRPLQRHELNTVAKAVGVENPESLDNRSTVRREIAAECELSTPGSAFGRADLLTIVKEIDTDPNA